MGLRFTPRIRFGPFRFGRRGVSTGLPGPFRYQTSMPHRSKRTTPRAPVTQARTVAPVAPTVPNVTKAGPQRRLQRPLIGWLYVAGELALYVTLIALLGPVGWGIVAVLVTLAVIRTVRRAKRLNRRRTRIKVVVPVAGLRDGTQYVLDGMPREWFI